MKRLILGMTAVMTLICVGLDEVSAEPIQWRVEDGGNGHWYEHVPEVTVWVVALDTASSMVHDGMDGYLATITSEVENTFLIDNFFQVGFLGGSDAQVEGEWRWTAGPEAGQLFFRGAYPDPNRQTLIYTDWGGNEPNDYDNTVYGFPYAGEDYLVFGTRAGGEWNDIPGAPYTSTGFYVEFGGTPIPEPGSLVTLGTFVLCLACRRRRRACRL